ncbi:MAG TPA: hypothetical protein VI546_00210 [candidate division Zixibacteria bacterium]|nr:hypothetical protein [candidate division Zixibacteria bacterium]
MSPVEMKKVFEDLREEVLALVAEKGPDSTLVNEVWIELKYNPVVRQLGIHLDCNTGTFEISEGQYTPRLEPEQNPITGELGLAPRFVSGALMLKKLDSVLALIDERVPLDQLSSTTLGTGRDKPQPEQKPALQRAAS